MSFNAELIAEVLVGLAAEFDYEAQQGAVCIPGLTLAALVLRDRADELLEDAGRPKAGPGGDFSSRRGAN